MRAFARAVAALVVSIPAIAAAAEEPGNLFNGKDLSGWDGDPAVWSVQDGVITGQTSAGKPIKHNTFLIWKGGTVGDFELRLMFKMESGNSGIQYRSKDKGDWVVNGYQGDMDSANTYTGMLYEEGGRGIVATPGLKVRIEPNGKITKLGTVTDPKEIKASIKKGDWNEYVIIAKGNHLVHMINGKVTCDITDEQESKRAMEGILALQVHAGPPMKVQFKEITLKK
ncbi:MAG TPA: DUF1080 domain-containing protein [Tepidisphaeraceae bacterium]|nr:DUF1080 domain-containing protein [Tepidisphaeraceae bacterium]